MPKDLYLFLDFDGVLHEDPQEQQIEIENPFVHVPAFEECMRQADPEGRVAIVISSMWRIDESLPQLKAHFSPDIAARIIDSTPVLQVSNMGWGESGDPRGHRQAEIQTWIAYKAPGAAWIALDDRKDGFKMPCKNLVLCTPYDEDGRGLDEFSLRELFWAIKDRLDPPIEAKKRPGTRP